MLPALALSVPTIRRYWFRFRARHIRSHRSARSWRRKRSGRRGRPPPQHSCRQRRRWRRLPGSTRRFLPRVRRLHCRCRPSPRRWRRIARSCRHLCPQVRRQCRPPPPARCRLRRFSNCPLIELAEKAAGIGEAAGACGYRARRVRTIDWRFEIIAGETAGVRVVRYARHAGGMRPGDRSLVLDADEPARTRPRTSCSPSRSPRNSR